MPSSSGSSQPRDQTQVSRTAGKFFTIWATREAQEYYSGWPISFPGDLLMPGNKLGSSALQADSLPAELLGKLELYIQLQQTRVQSLGGEDPLEEGLATHSSVLAWRIPWTKEPGRLQSTGLQKNQTQLKWLSTHICITMTDSHHCTAKVNTALLSNYSST